MTTPERLKRRQLIEGAMLIVIGLLMIVQSWYFNGQGREQRECLAENFAALSEALEVRSELTDRETAAARRFNTAELRVDSDEEYLAELQRYSDEIDAVRRERKENPLPPYPVGECS